VRKDLPRRNVVKPAVLNSLTIQVLDSLAAPIGVPLSFLVCNIAHTGIIWGTLEIPVSQKPALREILWVKIYHFLIKFEEAYK